MSAQPEQKLAALEAENRQLRQLVEQKSALAARAIASFQKRALHMEIIRQQNQELARLTADLQEARAREIRGAHAAGMAQVATEILHNVGNALNTVNVSLGTLRRLLAQFKIARLGDIARLLEEIDQELGGALSNHDKGGKILAFLELFTQHMTRQHCSICEELVSMTGCVDNIKAIIATQRQNTTASNLRETGTVEEIVEDALRLSFPGTNTHNIEVRCQVAALPPMVIDRHKLILILVNLMSNARHAVRSVQDNRGVITIDVDRCGDSRMRIQVHDNGIGIAPDDQSKIFQHGFTTKSDKHGFGLHSSANAIKQLGGSLTCFSKGLGYGATFTVELPFEPVLADEAISAHAEL